MTEKTLLIEELMASSLAEMKTRLVEGSQKTYSYGGLRDLSEHMEMLRREFAGSPELGLYHAALTVLIRRGIDLEANITKVQILWRNEGEFLCRNLDSRWLVSACDTIIDHWPDSSERALAMAGSLFTNTLKLYETERWSTGQYSARPEYRELSGRIPLHDGLSAFTIGQGDMIANLHRRVQSFLRDGSAAALILNELLKRASTHDTVYRRFRSVHKNAATLW